MRVQVVVLVAELLWVTMSELTGNVIDAALCYQKAIQQDPNKLANGMVCFTVLCYNGF